GLQYLTIPFFLAWKYTLSAFLLWIGCFMFGYRIHYSDLWRWVMFSELVFLIPEFLKFLWFLMTSGDPNYHDLVAFYPLSLMNLVDYELVDKKFHYPLKALNVFEIVYWFVLVIGIFYLSRKKWIISVYIVGSSYVLFFILWLGYYTVVYK
ncbi:MAG: sulfate ABC transporter permease, partial [Proteobacteria bacterium]|nr:sulfate ABC transporter permease [Pseudomonadota bacterium]